MKKALPACILAMAVMATASVAAKADTFDFDFTGLDGISGTGTLTGTATTAATFKLSAITGTVSDGLGFFTIGGLSDYNAADNVLYFPGKPVDFAGISFTSAGSQFNIFSYDGINTIELAYHLSNGSIGIEVLDEFVVLPGETPTAPAGAPAPLAGAGLLSFCGAGGLALRKRVKAKIGALLSRRLSAA